MQKVQFINSATGAPITGLTLAWVSLLKTSDGTAYTPQPAFAEIGGGYYRISATPTVDVVGDIDGGVALAAVDRYARGVTLGPNDDYLDAAVSSRSTFAGGAVASVTAGVTLAANQDVRNVSGSVTGSVGSVTSFGTLVADIAAAVWGATTRTLSAFGFFTYTAPPTVAEIRTEMDSNSTKLAHLDADITSRLATSGYTAPDNTDIALIKAKTDNLPASPAATSDIPSASTIATAVWAAGTRTLSSFGTLVADTATAVWGATTRTLSAFGFFTYTAPPTVAEIRTEMDSSSTKLAHLDADITSRLAASGYTAPDNTDIASILSAVNDGTHGLAALLTAIGTRMATFTYTAPDNADIGTIKTAIESATYGLNALLTAIEAVSSTGATPEEIWGAAERSLTTANTDESPSRDMAATGAVTGLYALTILVLDADDNPIPGVAVTLLNSDQTAFLSTLISDTDGYAHFSADPGVYKIRRMKAGYVFEDPDTVTIVDADVVHESRGVAYVVPASVDPEMQILSGTHTTGGVAVKAVPRPGQSVSSTTVGKEVLVDTTASTPPHTWQLTLIRGIEYDVTIERWGTESIIISSVAGADFTSYL